ncbi:MAG: CPXCG motif-containing cysteine-rich protein [Candidatus Margulisbacteria bacterium]|nr:CPXCG motif-containing cysteine-rich protein [Candidatus Margulisiibacteriota bacterium]
MTYALQSCDAHCPFCGETFEALIDTSIPNQSYIEDCEICCNPITFSITINVAGDVSLTTINDDD